MTTSPRSSLINASNTTTILPIDDVVAIDVDVNVRIPLHISSLPFILQDDEDPNRRYGSLFLWCFRPGVLWHGLFPILFLEGTNRKGRRDDRKIPASLLSLLFRESWDHSKTSRNAIRQIIDHQPDQVEKESNVDHHPCRTENELCACQTVALTMMLFTSTQPYPLGNSILVCCPTSICRRERRLNPQNVAKISLYILLHPSLSVSYVDRAFTALVLQHERGMLQTQAMTAWMATLGGGYFFTKQLNKSLQLARQQRILALKLGNTNMVRQCWLNEAYNLIYAGHFASAKQVLESLEEYSISKLRSSTTPFKAWLLQQDKNQPSWLKLLESKLNVAVVNTYSMEEQDVLRTLRQCSAARLLLRRLRKLSSRLKHYQKHQTVDDYQRLRLVVPTPQKRMYHK